jgi:hypothetical protein
MVVADGFGGSASRFIAAESGFAVRVGDVDTAEEETDD